MGLYDISLNLRPSLCQPSKVRRQSLHILNFLKNGGLCKRSAFLSRIFAKLLCFFMWHRGIHSVPQLGSHCDGILWLTVMNEEWNHYSAVAFIKSLPQIDALKIFAVAALLCKLHVNTPLRISFLAGVISHNVQFVLLDAKWLKRWMLIRKCLLLSRLTIDRIELEQSNKEHKTTVLKIHQNSRL